MKSAPGCRGRSRTTSRPASCQVAGRLRRGPRRRGRGRPRAAVPRRSAAPEICRCCRSSRPPTPAAWGHRDIADASQRRAPSRCLRRETADPCGPQLDCSRLWPAPEHAALYLAAGKNFRGQCDAMDAGGLVALDIANSASRQGAACRAEGASGMKAQRDVGGKASTSMPRISARYRIASVPAIGLAACHSAEPARACARRPRGLAPASGPANRRSRRSQRRGPAPRLRAASRVTPCAPQPKQ